MNRKPWVYAEVEHWTLQDLKETLALISTQEEADDFSEAYAEVCGSERTAQENIAYLVFLIGREEGAEIEEELAALFLVEPSDGAGKINHVFGYSSCGLSPMHPYRMKMEAA